MRMVDERPVLPRTEAVKDLKIALNRNLGEFADRSNKTIPKDGSEFTDAQSFSHFNWGSQTADIFSWDLPLDTSTVTIEPTKDLVIAGIVYGALPDGTTPSRFLTVFNKSAFKITWVHQFLFTAFPYRLILPNNVNFVGKHSVGIRFWYDLTSLRWRRVGFST